MLLITCPACGPRPEGEFTCLGEAVPARPDPNAMPDAQWADYIANRANIRGWHAERWWHIRNCQLIFIAGRDTLTHALRSESAEISP